MKLNTFALANTFAAIDLVLHPLFHAWVYFFPHTYEWAMNLFVAGLHVEITAFDTSLVHIAFGTVIEATVFWVLGFSVAFLYNKLAKAS